MSGFNPLGAFLRTFDTYFVGAFVGEGNAEVLLFTFLLGGTIGLVQRSGGALGLANALKGFMGERSVCTLSYWQRCCGRHASVVLEHRCAGCIFRLLLMWCTSEDALQGVVMLICLCPYRRCNVLYGFHATKVLMPSLSLSGIAPTCPIFFVAGTRTRGQVCTVALGCLIFFDDYSSILIVGNSLRDVVRTVGVRDTHRQLLLSCCLVECSPVWLEYSIVCLGSALSR